jgi:hypothetical protein
VSAPIYRTALEFFGHEPQLRMVQEEAAELITAVSHFVRATAGANYELAGEIADVEIMLEQARLLVGSDLVDRIKNEKLIRLSRMITSRLAAELPSILPGSNEVPRG